MTKEELAIRLEWSAHESWADPGLNDTEAYWAADPEGFIALEVDGRFEGGIAAMRYSPTFGFSALYKVTQVVSKGSPSVRYGIVRLLQSMNERLKGGIIGTTAEPDKARQYRRLGWVEPAWAHIRYKGVAEDIARDVTSLREEHVPVAGRGDCILVPAAAVPLEQVATYDATRFGARRDEFLRTWITLPTHRAWVCLQVSPPSGENAVRGFGIIRDCREGWQIGPLFADDEEIAEALFVQMVRGTDLTPIGIDIPEPNASGVSMLRRHGMTALPGLCYRMYHNGDPELPIDAIFGLTTAELG